MKIPLFRQLSTAGTIFMNTYEIVRLLVVSNVFFYKLNFQQSKFDCTTSTVHVFYQLYTPGLETIVVISNTTYLITMLPLQINAKIVMKFFFKCRRYHNYRIDLFTTTRIRHPLNVKLLRFGDSVVEVVYHYINATKRFENN